MNRDATDARPSPSSTTRPAIVAGLLILAVGLLVLRVLLWKLANDNFDMAEAYVVWQNSIIEHGRWHALRQPIGMYFPAYYDLTTITSYLDGRLSRFAQIKLLSLIFDIVAAVAAYVLARRLLPSHNCRSLSPKQLAAPFTILAGPTVILNGAVWGQCDVVFTSFLIFCVASLIEGHGALAVLLFGFAFAFKLQSVFLVPFMFAMLLNGRIRWQHLLLFPVGWILSMVPPLMNGASLSAYLTQFGGQTGAFDRLAIDVGNPWALAQWAGLSERVGLPIGLMITAFLVFAIGFWGRREQFRTPINTCALASLSALSMPYFMPKMGNRYFFTAEVLLGVLSCVDLSFALPAALTLVASLLVYTEYFLPYYKHLVLFASLLANSGAVWLVFTEIRSRTMDRVSRPFPSQPVVG